MNTCKLLEMSLAMTKKMLNDSVTDLSDADLMIRPAEGANHLAWQLGHLVVSEQRLGAQVPDAKYPELPAGFAEKHANKADAQSATSGFSTKAQYLELFNKTREATLGLLAKLTDADLDKPSQGPANAIVPNLGGVLNLVAMHTVMHGGQISVARRKLGKPVLF